MDEGLRILVVEDDPYILQILVDVLVDEGYRVRGMNNGQHALDYLATETPDLLILDVALPRIDGLSICRHIRRDNRLTRVPVVVISAFSHPNILEAIHHAGANHFLPKPFELDEVVQVVATLLSEVSGETTSPDGTPAELSEVLPEHREKHLAS